MEGRGLILLMQPRGRMAGHVQLGDVAGDDATGAKKDVG